MGIFLNSLLIKQLCVEGQQTKGLQAKYVLWPIFVNKVLLVHSHAHSFRYCLWWQIKADVSSCDRLCVLPSVIVEESSVNLE